MKRTLSNKRFCTFYSMLLSIMHAEEYYFMWFMGRGAFER